MHCCPGLPERATGCVVAWVMVTGCEQQPGACLQWVVMGARSGSFVMGAAGGCQVVGTAA